MMYKVICEISFPVLGIQIDVNIPINKTVLYVTKMLDKIIEENVSAEYQSKDNSILVNKRTGVVDDKKLLLKNNDICFCCNFAYYYF